MADRKAARKRIHERIRKRVSGTAERFDVFARVKHLAIPGGDTLKKKILALCTAWYHFQDSLL